MQKGEPKGKSWRKTFHQIVRENGIAFFLKEGKLKQNIVAQLSAESAEFLQNSARGKHELCQLCEIIMSFFKMDFVVDWLPRVLHPENYFVSTKARNEQFTEPITFSSLSFFFRFTEK